GCSTTPPRRNRWTAAEAPGLGSAQGTERRADLAREQLRLLPGGEVPAAVDLVEVGQARIRRLRPAARGRPDLAGERGEPDRDRRRRRRRAPGRRGVGTVGLPVRPGGRGA